MGYIQRKGFQANGLPAGKRDLRESVKLGSWNTRQPFKLALGMIVFILTFFYILIRNRIRRFNPKPKSIKGKVCFVTGSGRGLGRGICIALAKEGAIIACADINEEANSKTVEILSEMGAKAKAYKLNVADKQEVDAIAELVEKELGRVYLVVNNAGIIMPHPDPDEAYTRAIYGVNTLGPIWTTWAFLSNMKKHNEGHIVNISSIAAVYGSPGASMYASSKAALTTYAQALRLELKYEGYDNICVTTVHPGIINTSADYVDMLKWRFPFFEVDRVAKCVINSIKYNRGDVTTNPFLFFIGSLGKCVPVEVVEHAMKLCDITVILPTVKEYYDLSVSKTIKEISKI